MSLLLGIFILLACLIVGVRYGSLGLPVISGIGLIIYVFVLGYKPGTPPIAVMLTISQSSPARAICRRLAPHGHAEVRREIPAQ